jgi:hypothetical protein
LRLTQGLFAIFLKKSNFGYHSDDRTGDVLTRKIMGAIEMQSINTSKPNLIIIDEVDGASSAGGDNVQ